MFGDFARLGTKKTTIIMTSEGNSSTNNGRSSQRRVRQVHYWFIVAIVVGLFPLFVSLFGHQQYLVGTGDEFHLAGQDRPWFETKFTGNKKDFKTEKTKLSVNATQPISTGRKIKAMEKYISRTNETVGSESSKNIPYHFHLDPEDGDGFSACLLFSEDNHYLIEWLAYHYHFLPLRRLIVGVDPASRQSPKHILDRYENLIDVTIWNDTHVFDGFDVPEDRVFRHRSRQSLLISKCLLQFRKEKRTWVALVDTDEFIVIHSKANATFRALDVKPTLYQTLASPRNLNPRVVAHASCIPMRRVQMSTRSVPFEMNSKHWNYSQFMTVQLRWRAQYIFQGRRIAIAGKSLVHAGRNPTNYAKDWARLGPHRPIWDCPPSRVRVPTIQATYAVHHYPGTLEQYTFRKDPRKNVRDSQRFYQLEDLQGAEVTDDLPPTWVMDFANKVGHDLALYLLQDVGTVEKLPHPSSLELQNVTISTTKNNFTNTSSEP